LLWAAKAVNLLLSIFSTYLLCLISRRFLNRAVFLPIFFTLNSQFFYLSNQPLVEMTLLATILLTLYLDLKGSRLAYLGAGLASLARYEAALLIPILIIKDLLYEKRRCSTILLGFLSSIGIGVWMALSILKYGGDVNPYVYRIHLLGFGGVEFLKTMVRSLDPAEGLFGFVALSFGLLGVFTILKKFLKSILPTILFLLTYTVIHMIYPFGEVDRFAFPISWILLLFTIKGVEVILPYLRINPQAGLLRVGSIVLIFCLFLIGFHRLILLRDLSIGPYIFIIYSFLIIYLLSCLIKERGWKKVLMTAASSSLLIWIAGVHLQASVETMEEARYSNATHRVIAEWYSENAKEGDKLLMAMPWFVYYFSDLPLESFALLNDFKSRDSDSFISELKEKNITHVVWDDGWCDPTNEASFMKKSILIFDLLRGVNLPHFKLIKSIEVGPSVAYIYRFIP